MIDAANTQRLYVKLISNKIARIRFAEDYSYWQCTYWYDDVHLSRTAIKRPGNVDFMGLFRHGCISDCTIAQCPSQRHYLLLGNIGKVVYLKMLENRKTD